VRICHVTPILPPDYLALAMLPALLGHWSACEGDEVRYLSHPAPTAAPAADDMPYPVTWIPAGDRTSGVAHLRTPGRVVGIGRAVLPDLRWADVVHVHGDSLLSKTAALVAQRLRKPTVLTLYGTEIWQHEPRRWRPDLFTRAYRGASHVVFYSQGLLTRATAIGLGRRHTSVIYPPVTSEFVHHDALQQADARTAVSIHNRHLLVTVRRIDALGGHRCLLEALSEIIRTHPDTRLVICGTGPLMNDVKTAARGWGVEGHVTFTGSIAPDAVARYDAAADAFVLASELDACPPGALEALACGTPVIAADNPGVLELRELFGFDVTITPHGNALALARALVHLLDDKRRVQGSTRELLDQEFRPAHVLAQYRAVYQESWERSQAEMNP
jgi:glycosyltransferase involved in cell wall biosynthesis